MSETLSDFDVETLRVFEHGPRDWSAQRRGSAQTLQELGLMRDKRSNPDRLELTDAGRIVLDLADRLRLAESEVSRLLAVIDERVYDSKEAAETVEVLRRIGPEGVCVPGRLLLALDEERRFAEARAGRFLRGWDELVDAARSVVAREIP